MKYVLLSITAITFAVAAFGYSLPDTRPIDYIMDRILIGEMALSLAGAIWTIWWFQ